jgi:PAS domain S-box-containing protein
MGTRKSSTKRSPARAGAAPGAAEPTPVITGITLLEAAGEGVSGHRQRPGGRLEESERKLAEAQRIAHLGSWEWEIADDVISWSDETFRLFGLVPDETTRTFEAYLGLIHPADRAEVRRVMARAREDGLPFAIEHRIVRPDDITRYLHSLGRVTRDAEGRPWRMVGTVQDITDAKKAEAQVMRQTAISELLRAVATAANEAATLEQAVQIGLARVCAFLQWPVGHLYRPSREGPDLEPTTVWHLEDAERFQVFVRATMATRMSPGIGLPGRVLGGGKPVWVVDALSDPNFVRARNGEDIGLRAGLGVPILVGSRVVGVMEFFSPEAREPDEAVMAVMVHIGTTLGRVAEREEADATLRASEARYRRLIETTFEGVWTIDARDRTSFVNHRMAEMLGHAADALVGRSVFDFLFEADRPLAEAKLERLRAGIREVYEFRFRRRDGSTLLTLLSTSPIAGEDGVYQGALAMATDITEMRQAEQVIALRNAQLEAAFQALRVRNAAIEAKIAQRTRELASQKALLERIVTHASAAIVYVDPQRVIRWANPAFAQIARRPIPALANRPLFEAFPQGREPFEPLLKRVLDTGELFHASGYPVRRQTEVGEQTTYWDFSFVPVAEEGRLVGVLLISVETTARVEQARRQREQIEALHTLDRQKTDFFNMVSHELRTPLTSVLGYTEFLEDQIGGALTGEQREFVKQIRHGVMRLQQLVSDILDFARLDAGTFRLNPEESDLNALIAMEVAGMQPQAQDAGLTLRTELPDRPVMLRVDPVRIGQVIRNLIGNAINFTEAGGRITVTMQARPARVRIEVADTGVGIDPNDLPKLFQRFSQLAAGARRGGTGLGLAISKAIVEAHRGAIGVESEPGRGSTFWFTLPTG